MNKFIMQLNDLAKKAMEEGEIPIACIIVKNDQIIGYGTNNRELENKIHGHAEITAINQAAKRLNTWKLNDCEMYISTEPCLMCYGAILQARIKKVYVASCQDEKKQLCFKKHINNDNLIDYSLVNEDSSKMIKNFFQNKRV